MLFRSENFKEEVKEVKYDKFGPEEGKFEEVKGEAKLDIGGADNYGAEVIKEEKEVKKYGGKGGYGGGYGGGHKKEIFKEEVTKEKNYGADIPAKGSEGGYLIPDDSGKADFGPEPEKSFDSISPDGPKKGYGKQKGKGGRFGIDDKFDEDKGGDYEGKPLGPKGGYGKQEGKKGGFGIDDKFDEGKDGGYEGKPLGPKGGYGDEEKLGKQGAYGDGFEAKTPKGGYGGELDGPKEGPKGGYGEEKVEESFKKEKQDGYGEEKPFGPKEGYAGPKGGFADEKIDKTFKEGGSYGGAKYGKGGYGGEEKKVFEETKEIKSEFGGDSYGTGKQYGGGYGGEKKFGDEFGGPKPGESFSTLSTKACNKLMDGLFVKQQNT